MSEVTMPVTLVLVDCCACGMQFAVSGAWEGKKREDHSGFRCPNGCFLAFGGESASEKANRLRIDAEKRLQAQINEERHLRLVAEKDRESEKRKRRKIEKRIAAGVCPCCNRTFEDLHRHMKTKHKGYALPPGKAKAIAGATEAIQ